MPTCPDQPTGSTPAPPDADRPDSLPLPLSAPRLFLLLFALAGTAEALTKGGMGEAGMLFLLPMYVFPILLALSGLVRWTRRPKTVA